MHKSRPQQSHQVFIYPAPILAPQIGTGAFLGDQSARKCSLEPYVSFWHATRQMQHTTWKTEWMSWIVCVLLRQPVLSMDLWVLIGKCGHLPGLASLRMLVWCRRSLQLADFQAHRSRSRPVSGTSTLTVSGLHQGDCCWPYWPLVLAGGWRLLLICEATSVLPSIWWPHSPEGLHKLLLSATYFTLV